MNVYTPFLLLHENHIFYKFLFSTPIRIHIVRGIVILNVYTPFLLLHENHIFYNFRFSTPVPSHIVRGRVYIEFVYTVPVAT